MNLNYPNNYNPFKPLSKDESNPIDNEEKPLEQISIKLPLSKKNNIANQFNGPTGQDITQFNTDKDEKIINIDNLNLDNIDLPPSQKKQIITTTHEIPGKTIIETTRYIINDNNPNEELTDETMKKIMNNRIHKANELAKKNEEKNKYLKNNDDYQKTFLVRKMNSLRCILQPFKIFNLI